MIELDLQLKEGPTLIPPLNGIITCTHIPLKQELLADAIEFFSTVSNKNIFRLLIQIILLMVRYYDNDIFF